MTSRKSFCSGMIPDGSWPFWTKVIRLWIEDLRSDIGFISFKKSSPILRIYSLDRFRIQTLRDRNDISQHKMILNLSRDRITVFSILWLKVNHYCIVQTVMQGKSIKSGAVLLKIILLSLFLNPELVLASLKWMISVSQRGFRRSLHCWATVIPGLKRTILWGLRSGVVTAIWVGEIEGV